MGNKLLDVFYKKSLSLVELMIISVIATIVIIIIGQKFLGFDDDSKKIVVEQNIRSIEGALNLYKKDIGHYPRTEETLNILLADNSDPNWKGPYIRSEYLIDPWGKTYLYLLINDNNYIISPQKR